MEFKDLIENIYKKHSEISNNGLTELWIKWFNGYDSSFHEYSVYNGKQHIRRTKKSLKMFKKVCEDWASLLFNEKTNIVVKSQEAFNILAEEIDLYGKGNSSVEFGFGLSMCGLVINIKNLTVEVNEKGEGTIKKTGDEKLELQLIPVSKIVPLSFKGKSVTECAFIEVGSTTTQISIHKLNDKGEYEIVDVKVDNKTKQPVGEPQTFYTYSKTPYFAIISPNIANNLDIDSPLPISVCANAIDLCKHVDDIFDSYNNEFILGKKRTFVSAELNTVGEDGKIKSTFDPKDTTIYVIPKSTSINGESDNLIKSVSDPLRTTDHQIALKDALNLLSSAVGLGNDYYNFEKGRVMTATQVISEKSDTFRTLRKHEKKLAYDLSNLVRSLMNAYNLFIEEGTFEDTDEVEIQFDDSIIEDKATEKENDKKDVELGAMSLVAYRMKWYGEDEETAKEEVAKIYGDADFYRRLANFSPFLVQGTITPLQFVKMVYLDVKGEAEQNALAEEIKANLKSGGEVFSDAELMNLRGAL